MKSQLKISILVQFLYKNIFDVVYAVAALASRMGEISQELGILYPEITVN